MRQSDPRGYQSQGNGNFPVIWPHASIALFALCLLLTVFTFNLKRQLRTALYSSKRYNSLQGSFSKAVTGMEASLNKEKNYNARLERALDCIQDGVAILDSKQQINFANASLWKHYGVAPDQVKFFMGRNWLALYNSDGRADIEANVLPVLSKKGMWCGESSIKSLDGDIKRAELYISKTEEGYIGFIRDVSERYNAQKDKEKMDVQLHEFQKLEALERVVRNFIHEFSNGLCAIGGCAEMLMEDLKEKSDHWNCAEKIFLSKEKMQLLITKTRQMFPD